MTPDELRQHLNQPGNLAEFSKRLSTVGASTHPDPDVYVRLLGKSLHELEAMYAWAAGLPTEEQKQTLALEASGRGAEKAAAASESSAKAAAEALELAGKAIAAANAAGEADQGIAERAATAAERSAEEAAKANWWAKLSVATAIVSGIIAMWALLKKP